MYIVYHLARARTLDLLHLKKQKTGQEHHLRIASHKSDFLISMGQKLGYVLQIYTIVTCMMFT